MSRASFIPQDEGLNSRNLGPACINRQRTRNNAERRMISRYVLTPETPQNKYENLLRSKEMNRHNHKKRTEETYGRQDKTREMGKSRDL